MKQHRSIVFILAIAGIVFGVAKTRGGETQSGDWTIRRSDAQGKVEFALMDSSSGHHFHYSSDWPASEFSGLDFAKPGRQEVHFTIARDAGKFECEGFLHDGEGAGLFHFLPDAKYPQEMKSLGFEKIDGDKQFAMAIHDVSLKFAREIKNENLQGLDTDKLIAFRIHGVSPEFITGIRSAGLNVSDSDKLIAFRIHGVSPEFISDIRSAGFSAFDSDKLIAFRIHGVSPEVVSGIPSAGFNISDSDKLNAFRIYRVTPEKNHPLRHKGHAAGADETKAIR